MAGHDEVMARAAKLLAMVEGAATKAEAQAALLALQRLLAKEHMTMEEVQGAGRAKEAERVEEVDGAEQASYPLWQVKLASTVAKNYRCGVYWQGTARGYWGRGRREKVVFYGLATDAEVAAKAYRATVSAAKNCWRDYYPKAKECMACYGYEWEASKHRNEYLRGFADGIADAYAQQTRTDQTAALMVRKPKEVVRYEEDLHLVRCGGSFAGVNHHGSAYGSGRQAGQAVGAGNAVSA